MAHYDIFIWETETLYGLEGQTPAERVKTYIEGVFDHINDHTVGVLIQDNYPRMYESVDDCYEYTYEQRTDQTVTTSVPCGSGTIEYGGITPYFNDWLY